MNPSGAVMDEVEVTGGQEPLPEPAPHTRWTGPAAVAVTAGALWVVEVLGSPSGALSAAHPTLLGVPGELAFALVAGAVLALRSGPTAQAYSALVLGLLWSSVILAMPVYHAGEAHWGLQALLGGWAVGRWAGGAWVVLSLATLAGWWLLWRHISDDESSEDTPRPWNLGGVLAGAVVSMVGCVIGDASLAQGALRAGLIAALIWGLRKCLTQGEVPGRARLETLSKWALPGLVLCLYGLLKTHGMGASATDENIYFYMASRLSHGEWPYLDYFFAHPPLHVLLPGGLFAITGFNLTLAKTLSALAGGVTGWAVWSIARARMGVVGALVAMVACLFAAETLKATTNLTGVNLTVMWMMLACRASLKGLGGRAGVFMALAACTGFYSIAAVCALLLVGAFRTRTFALRQLVGFAAVFGAVQGLFLISAGDAFLDGVYRYHGLKAFKDSDMWPLWTGEHAPPAALLHNLGVVLTGKAFTKDVFYHAHLWLGGVLAPIAGALVWALNRPRGEGIRRFLSPRNLWLDSQYGWAGVLWLVTLSLLLELAMFRELYSFYFSLLHPLLALCLAFVVVRGLDLVCGAVTSPETERPRAIWLALGLALLVALSGWETWSARALRVFPDELENAGQRNEYVWKPAAVAPGLSGVVEALFWKDHRIKGELERGYNHYLWNKKRAFETLPEIGAYIRSNSAPDETVTGASTAAPLVALEAGRRMAADEVDTNNKRFKTGMLDERTFWEAICADRVRFIVSTSMSYFTRQRMRNMPTARRWFRPVKVFNDPGLKYGRTYPITLYERVGPPPDEDRVCRWEGN